jgi:thiamine biosynthesis lipoprotein
MKSVLSEVRRARPLLGTFVEVTAEGPDQSELNQAIDKAFAAVNEVHRLMSFHEPTSDVSRLNEEAMHKPVQVHPATELVLRAAKEFSSESNGVFDITVASTLSALQFLPQRGTRAQKAGWRDIIFVGDHKVRFRHPLTIDLGGIAKGFAVDRATEALIAAGVRTGVVNAGGDLRVFGPKTRLVQIRHPNDPARIGATVILRDTSLATSALYFSQRVSCGRSPLIDGRTHRPVSDKASVSVYASDCMTADALTKIVFALRDDAEPILDRHCAGSLLLGGESPFGDFSDEGEQE